VLVAGWHSHAEFSVRCLQALRLREHHQLARKEAQLKAMSKRMHTAEALLHKERVIRSMVARGDVKQQRHDAEMGARMRKLAARARLLEAKASLMASHPRAQLMAVQLGTCPRRGPGCFGSSDPPLGAMASGGVQRGPPVHRVAAMQRLAHAEAAAVRMGVARLVPPGAAGARSGSGPSNTSGGHSNGDCSNGSSGSGSCSSSSSSSGGVSGGTGNTSGSAGSSRQ